MSKCKCGQTRKAKGLEALKAEYDAHVNDPDFLPRTALVEPSFTVARQYEANEEQYTWTAERNAFDRTAKPSPRRHTGPLRDLLLGACLGAGIVVFCFLIGFAEVYWWGW